MAATRGGLGDASGAGLAADQPIEKAWDSVCESLTCTSSQLATAVASSFRIDVADLSDVDQGALALVPHKLAQSLRVLPLRSGDREIIVATSEPLDYEAERQIGFVTSRRAVFQVADPSELSRAILDAYTSQESRDPLSEPDLDEAYDKVQPDQEAIARAPVHTREASVVKICRLILYEAAMAGATEVHMSRGASTGRIQFKVGGKLTIFMRIPIETLMTATERIRGMADVGDSQSRVMRSLNVRIDKKPYEIAVQTVPGYPYHLVLGLTGEQPQAPSWGAEEESNGHILVVDDDEGARLLMRTILEKNGFRVSEADDGSTALPMLDDAEDIDGILLDLMMTTVDGMETLTTVRASRKLAALPVIILTASQKPEDERRLLRAGADDYLKKPIDPRQLLQRLQAVLKRAQSYGG